MENQIEGRVSRLEKVTATLAKSSELINIAVSGLIEEVATGVREQVKQEVLTSTEAIKRDVVETVFVEIDNKVRDAVNDRGLIRSEMESLRKARNMRLRQLLGDSKGDKYILLISFYQGAMIKGYRKLFDCGAYGDIAPTRYLEALKYINNFEVTPSYYNWAIETLHNQYRDGEIENKKKFNAYERFFGIRVI